MKWIIITTPTFISHEAKYIDQLFEAGIDLLHLRKPDSTPEECELLIQKIDPKMVSSDRNSRPLRTLREIPSPWHSPQPEKQPDSREFPGKHFPLLPQFRGSHRIVR